MNHQTQINKSINRFAYNATKEDKEDMTQECHIRLLNIPESSPWWYVNAICKNIIMDFYRREKRFVASSIDDTNVKHEVERSTATIPDFDDVDILNGLSKLSFELEWMVRLRYGIGCEPHTREEIAGLLHVTERFVRYREEIALERLREFFKEN